ncbi:MULTISPECIES: hypothetical protein [unclassified Pseudomonas]|uniref:hypothetical protein n=1 Tax=unclassified Pseudomonas TaxID=196821 RepID=UPI000CD03A78|nr:MULTISPECIES: hypothetical protein [unclassified Pseudomonas]POA26370.1 hypothetical protein C1895_06105 [Pseudomonas sp. FW305-3-2-15-E-TSA4]POA44628.1 hypothetical protein C1894_04685 [Pseudomonas sp. FW305-3-2-15-E-TSA2]
MTQSQKRAKDRFLSFLLLSVFSVVLAVIVAVGAYRYTFGGTLAVTSVEWSNFGGYIGGLVGPLVSFVTLLAVLKTVYMQRELLDVQKHEFNQLLEFQRLESLKQDEQLLLAKSEANRAKVHAYQTSLLNVLESFSNECRLESNEMFAAADKVSSDPLDVILGNKAVEKYKRRGNEARRKVADFKILAFELSVAEFSEVSEVREKFAPRLLEIINRAEDPQ